jgi:hypothetical protein
MKINRTVVMGILVISLSLCALAGCHSSRARQTAAALSDSRQPGNSDIWDENTDASHLDDLDVWDAYVKKRFGTSCPRPIKVYDDCCNVVIVLSLSNGIESGKYIVPGFSSHSAMEGWKGFTFTLVSNGITEIYDYRRNIRTGP